MDKLSGKGRRRCATDALRRQTENRKLGTKGSVVVVCGKYQIQLKEENLAKLGKGNT